MVKFNFFGDEIIITDDRDRYNTIRLYYDKVAYQCREEFVKKYKENNMDLEDVIDKGYTQGAEIIVRVITKTVDALIEKKFYSINNELFIEKYCKNAVQYWEDAYCSINDKYMNIVLDEQQKEEYRQYRKNSRGRWQGGGFGIRGAVKGAVKAGAMNAVTGMAHETFNLVGKIGSNIEARMKKSKVFNDPNTLETLANGIYLSIFHIHYSYANFLKDNKNIKFRYVHKQEADEVDVVLSNIKNANIEKSEKVEILKNLINLNPYEESIYTYAINSFGDENEEIYKIAKYFGCDLYRYKYSIINKISNSLKANTEEETIQAKNILLKEAKRLGLQEDLDLIINLEERLKKFDLEARTLDGIVFADRDEVNLAKEEKAKIESILNNVNMNSETEVLELRNKILGLKLNTIIVNSYIDNIDKKINEFDLQARTVDNFLFESREEAIIAREEKVKIDRMMNEVNFSNKYSIEQLKKKIQMENFKSSIGDEVIKDLDEKLKLIEEKERTVEGVLFDNKEDAYIAQMENLKLKEILNNINLKNKEDLEKAKKQIETGLFKTKLVEVYIDKINNIIENINSKKRDRSRKIKKISISCTLIICFIIICGLFVENRNHKDSQVKSENKSTNNSNYEQYNNYEDKKAEINNEESLISQDEHRDEYENTRKRLKRQYIEKLDKIESEVSGFNTDLNTKEKQDMILKKWDDALNDIYGVLKTKLPSLEMEELRQEQRDWIKNRDYIAQSTASEFNDLDMYDLSYTQSLSNQTKERCYELVETYMQ